MAQAGYLEQKRIRPGSAAIVVAMHGAALAALLLAKHELVDKRASPPLVTRDVKVDIPEPEPPRPDDAVPEPRAPLVYTAPPIPSPRPTAGPAASDPPVETTQIDATHGEEEIRRPQPQPEARPEERVIPPPPVRVAAQLDSRSALQPPYPPSEQRLEREGQVVIRVTIGANGRVVSASKVSATSDAFYAATERHARAQWRFRPATVDGRAIESQKTMTVHFRLEG